jgi:CRP-like cAMP-binding protein
MGPEELSAMLGCLTPRIADIPKGEPVFLEGDEAGFIGFVLDGAIQIVRDDFYGNRSILSHAGQGEAFAEAFACAQILHMPVSAYALKDSKIVFFSCKKMLTVCTSACRFHNQLVRNLLTVVAGRSLELGKKIQVMSQKTTREKLLAYLMQQAKERGNEEFTIPFNRQALADYLGVERSAMSAELSKLRTEGILDTKGSYFHLYN